MLLKGLVSKNRAGTVSEPNCCNIVDGKSNRSSQNILTTVGLISNIDPGKMQQSHSLFCFFKESTVKEEQVFIGCTCRCVPQNLMYIETEKTS